MDDEPDAAGMIDAPELDDHCAECGHAWVDDEPAHYADCRFFFLDNDPEEEDDLPVIPGFLIP